MSRKRKRKVYKYGDVATVRLSPDSNCTQEVLDWINEEDRQISKGFIEAVKLQIILENKMSNKMIRENLFMKENIVPKSDVEMSDKLLSDLHVITEEHSNKSRNIDALEIDAEDEIFGGHVQDIEPRKSSPGLRAMRSIQRNN